MSAFEVAFPPLWHEAREAISVSTINRAAIPIRFRIENNSRTNAGCKPVFDKAIASMIEETHRPKAAGKRIAPDSYASLIGLIVTL